jgi:hypothetical protein
MPLVRAEILTAVLMEVQVFGITRRNCIYQYIWREHAQDLNVHVQSGKKESEAK